MFYAVVRSAGFPPFKVKLFLLIHAFFHIIILNSPLFDGTQVDDYGTKMKRQQMSNVILSWLRVSYRFN